MHCLQRFSFITILFLSLNFILDYPAVKNHWLGSGPFYTSLVLFWRSQL